MYPIIIFESCQYIYSQIIKKLFGSIYKKIPKLIGMNIYYFNGNLQYFYHYLIYKMFWIILLVIFTIISICLFYYRTKRQVTIKNNIAKENKVLNEFENMHNNSNNKIVEKIDEENNKSNDTTENIEVINNIQNKIDNINKDIIEKQN